MKKSHSLLSLSRLATVLLLMAGSLAKAATLNVTNGNDSGAGSLRNQIAAAASGDTIAFSGVTTVTLTSAQIVLNKNLTINGGSGVTITRGGATEMRLLVVDPSRTVSISNVTFTNGLLSSEGGGAIYNNGTLTLTACTFSGNNGQRGGALCMGGTTLTVNDCLFSGNGNAGNSQGAAAELNGGTSNFNRCTFTGNTSSIGSQSAIVVTGGTLNLSNCTAAANNGAYSTLYVAGTGSIANVTNCTFSGNAGAVQAITAVQSTTTNVKNSLFTGTGLQMFAQSPAILTSQGNNIVSDSSLPGAVASDKLNTNPLVGPLASNGGTTQTCALLPGSPAINAGNGTGAPTADQRGIARVGTVDIGAYESRGFTMTVAGGNNQSATVSTPFASSLSVTVSSANGEPVTGGRVTFTAPGSGAGCTFAGSPATISGSSASSGTVTANATAGGPYTVSASAAGVTSGVNFSLTNNPVPPDINLRGNSTNIADGDSTPSSADHTDFGSVLVSSGSFDRTFTIQNTGGSNLTLAAGSITLSGASAGDFVITSITLPATVAAGASTTFGVRFDPSATGSRTATVNIASNDPDAENPYTFAIQGTGTAPDINLRGNSVSIANGDTTPASTDDTDFGSQAVAGGTLVRTYTIQNTGNASLSIATISAGGDFAVSGIALPATINAAGSTTFTVTFDPSAAGVRNATVSIGSDDPDENPYTFAIQGTGTAPADYVITTAGGILTLTDNSGLSETLNLQNASPGQLRFYGFLNTSTFSLNGAPLTTGESASIPLAGITRIVVNAGEGTNVVNITSITDTLPTLEVNGGSGDDRVNLDRLTFASGANVTVNLNDDAASPGSDTIGMGLNDFLTLSGTGTVHLECSRAVELGDGSSITTASGNITLRANQQAAATSGLFTGVDVSGSITSTTGDVLIEGRSGDSINGGTGVRIGAGSVRGRNVTLTGRSNFAGGTNYGVLLSSSGSTIAASGGNVTINGTASQTAGTANITSGVSINNAAISATGSGNVSITGTGANSSVSGANRGIVLDAGTISVTAESGSITFNGIPGPNNSAGMAFKPLTPAGTVSISTTGGPINLFTDALSIPTAGVSISNGPTGTVTLAPRTAGLGVSVGNAAAGSLALLESWLDIITTGNLIIGSATAGDLTVSGVMSRIATTNISLLTGGSITQNQTIDTGGGTLLLDCGSSPASIKPKASGTDVTASTLSFGSDVSFNIAGTTAQTEYDQLVVAGSVDVTGDTLVLTGAYVPVGGNSFTLIDNDGSDPIAGTFSNLANGGTITFNGVPMVANYSGGTGNDLVLSVPLPASLTVYNGLDFTDPVLADGQTEAVDFGSVIVGSDTIRSFRLRNTGGSTLNISNITLPNRFTIVGGAPTSLAPNISAPLTIRYTPQFVGTTNSGSIQIANDSAVAVFDFPVTGMGAAPDVTVEVAPASVLENAAANLVYTFTRTGPTTAEQEVNFEVSGTADIASDFTISAAVNAFGTATVVIPAGQASASVTVDPTEDSLLESDETVILTVGESPNGILGGDDATGTITNDDVAMPEIDVRGLGISIPNNDNTPGTADGTQFGSMTIAAGSVTRTFTIANNGTATLNVTAASVGDTQFAISSISLPAAIPAGGSATFTLTFDPSIPGFSSATVRLTSNDADEGEYSFMVEGRGTNSVPTDITLSPGTIAENNAAGDTAGTLTTTDADSGDSFTYSLVSGAGDADNGSFVIVGNTLRLSLSADFETKNTYSVRVQTADGSDTFARAFEVTVGNVNEMPAFTVGPNRTHPALFNTAQTVAGWATAINDGDSTVTQALSFNVSNDNNSLFTVQPAIAPDGTLTYTTSGTAGSATVSVSLTDDSSINGSPALTTAIQTFTLSVAAGPEIDIQGNGVSIVNNDTTPSTADHTDFGTVSVSGGFVDRTFIIRNTGTAALSISTISTFGSHATDFSMIGFPGASVPAGGQASLTYRFDPTLAGPRQATVSIANGDADENPFILTLGGQGQNSAPTDLSLSPGFIAENNAPNETVGTFSTTDPDSGDNFTYSLVNGAGDADNASFTITGDALRLTPSADFETKNSYSIRVQTSDGTDTFTKALTILIRNVNEMPSFTKGSDFNHPAAFTVPQTVNGWATGISHGDPGATQALQFNVSTDSPALFTAQPSISPAGTLTYTPSGTSGTATVFVSLTDDASINGTPALTTQVQTFLINVAAGPDLEVSGRFAAVIDNGDTTPSADDRTLFPAAQVAAGTSDQPYTLLNRGMAMLNIASITFSGPHAADFSIFGTAPTFLAAGATDTLNIRFNPSATGARTATVIIASNDPDENPYTFAISGEGTNQTPASLALNPAEVRENSAPGTAFGTLTTVDSDTGDTFTYALVSGAGDTDNASFSISGDQLKVEIPTDYETRTSYTVRIRTTDSVGAFTEAAFPITVLNVNEAPVITITGTPTLPEDGSGPLTNFSFSDVDAGSATVQVAFGVSAYSPFRPTQLIGRWDATSGGGVTVRRPVNDFLQQFLILEGSFADINAFIAAGSVLFSTEGSEGGDQGWSGAIPCSILAEDLGNSGLSGAANTNRAFDLIISPVNDRPRATALTVSTNEDTPLPLALSGTDEENTTLTFSIVTSPAHGTVTQQAGGWVYAPAADYSGPDSFTFAASDGNSTSLPAAVSITVTPVNDRPVLTVATAGFTVAEDTNGSITGISFSDIDAGTEVCEAAFEDEGWNAVSGGGVTVIRTGIHLNLRGSLADLNAFIAAGNLKFQAPADFTGTVAVSIRISDEGNTGSGGPLADSDDYSITVTAVNDAPTAAGQSVETDEDIPLPVTLSGSDPESLPLNYSIVTSPANGTLSGSGANRTYTPAANFHGADSFTFRVNDGELDSGIATVTIKVNPVNDAPLATPQALGTLKNVALPIVLSGSDTENSPLTFAVTGNPANGALSGTAPNLTYTPAFNFVGSDSLRFRVNDGNLDSTEATITISVGANNIAPVAGAQSVSTDEDTPLPITLTATDADLDSLTYSIVSSPSNGTLTGTAPSFTYTPAANYSGTDSFTFKANDGTVDSPTVTISITVRPVNDRPVVQDLSVATDEDTALPVTLSGADVENTPLTYRVVSAPAHGAFASGIYTPAQDFFGPDSFTYVANDGTEDGEARTVSITVRPVNDRPTITSIANQDTGAGTATPALPFTVGDVETAAGALEITATSSNLTLLPVSGIAFSGAGAERSVILTPAAAQVGSSAVRITVSDGELTSFTEFTLTVTGDARVAVFNGPGDTSPALTDGQTATVAWPDTFRGASADRTFHVRNLGPVPLNVSGITLPSGFALTAPFTAQSIGQNQGFSFTVRFTPTTFFDAMTGSVQIASNDPATAVFDFPISGRGILPEATITVAPSTVTETGSANLVFTVSRNGPVTEPQEVNLRVSGTAERGIDYSFSGITVSEAGIGTITIPAGESGFSFAADPSADAVIEGEETVVAGISESPNITGDGSATGNITDSSFAEVAVLDVTGDSELTDAQTAAVDFGSYTAPGSVRRTFRVTNTGSAPLSLTAVSLPAQFVLDAAPAPAVLAPSASYEFAVVATLASPGTLSREIAILTSDADEGEFTFPVSATRLAAVPVAIAQNLTTAEDTALPITLSGSDADMDALTYSVLTGPASGTLSGTAPNLTYTPSANFHGSDSFTFRVNDDTTDSAPATITLTVTPVNDAPAAAAQILTTAEDTALPLTLTGSDADMDALTYSVLTGPASGTLSGTAPNLIYTPSANFHGSDSFTFRVNDGNADSPPATIAITVTPVNDAPALVSALPGTLHVRPGLRTTIPLAAHFTDLETPPAGLSFSVPSASVTGFFTASVNGTDLVLDGLTPGVTVLTLEAADAGGLTVQTTASFRVKHVPEVSTPVPDQRAQPAGSAVSIDLAGHFLDRDSDSLTFSLRSNSLPFTVQTSLTGSTLSLQGLLPGVATLVVDATDTDGNTVSDTFAVSVGTEFPTITSAGALTLERQTGLYVQRVNVSNTTGRQISGFRLNVTGLSAGVTLYNATLAGGSFVDAPVAMAPGTETVVTLVYQVPGRRIDFTPVITVSALGEVNSAGDGAGLAVERIVQLPSGDLLVEFLAIPGRRYEVEYSGDLTVWKKALSPVQAGASRVMWIDRGAPTTESHPSTVAARWYRVRDITPATR